ncbi:MAG: winged helix-turn-helix domain-containing protein [Candidatus Gracilibacteria bacterium]
MKTLIYKTNFSILDSYDFIYHDGFFVRMTAPTEQHVNFCLHLRNLVPGKNIFLLIDRVDIEMLNVFKESVKAPIFLAPFAFRNIAGIFEKTTSIDFDNSQKLEVNGIKFRLDPTTRILHINDRSFLKLVNKEFFIMKFLFSQKGKIVSKLDLFEFIWGKNLLASTDTVDVHMSRLRKKLKDFIEFELIKTVPCAGYILE